MRPRAPSRDSAPGPPIPLRMALRSRWASEKPRCSPRPRAIVAVPPGSRASPTPVPAPPPKPRMDRLRMADCSPPSVEQRRDLKKIVLS